MSDIFLFRTLAGAAFGQLAQILESIFCSDPGKAGHSALPRKVRMSAGFSVAMRYIRERGETMSNPRLVRLSESEIAAALSTIPGWKVENGKLHREYKFVDFIAAFSFMAGAALVAQAMDHHPEWFNVWNTVRIDLVTHDIGGITAFDVTLARSMEELASRQLGR